MKRLSPWRFVAVRWCLSEKVQIILAFCSLISIFADDFIVNPLSGLRVSPEWTNKKTVVSTKRPALG